MLPFTPYQNRLLDITYALQKKKDSPIYGYVAEAVDENKNWKPVDYLVVKTGELVGKHATPAKLIFANAPKKQQPVCYSRPINNPTWLSTEEPDVDNVLFQGVTRPAESLIEKGQIHPVEFLQEVFDCVGESHGIVGSYLRTGTHGGDKALFFIRRFRS